MYTKRLETFLCVAEAGSFSKAAQQLYITPSAVVQQMNQFEQDLHCTLFVRSSQGVQLTEEGKLLFEEGTEIVQRCRAVTVQLEQMRATTQGELCIGIHMLRKCRVFNQLWPRFQAKHPTYTLQIQDLDWEENSTQKADLIESVRDAHSWEGEWNFLPVCTVPLVCAVSRQHPLAQKSRLTFDDLRPYGLITIRHGMQQELQNLYRDAEQHGVPLIEVPSYDLSVFTLCELNQYALQIPACWQDLSPDLVTIPCEWPYTLPYGFFSHRDASRATRVFLEFVRETMRHEALRPE
jgi:DNA-binding transcriptional LysR family regulator